MAAPDNDTDAPGADLPAEGALTKLDATWSVVSSGPDPHLHCVLRRRAGGGIDLLTRDWSFSAVGVTEGRVPVRGYRADSRWKPRRRGKWLMFATLSGDRVGVVAFEGPETAYAGSTRGDTWPDPDMRDAKRLARSLRSVSASVEEQLAHCGYARRAHSNDGLFEVYGNKQSPGLPQVCRSGERWSFLSPPSELWYWNAALSVPDDVPDRESMRRWAPEAGKWLIPTGPVGPFRGKPADLFAYHHLDPEKGGRLGSEFHRWAHPSPHFHHGPFMVAGKQECTAVDRRNRDWRGSLATLKWRKTGEWGVEP
ncbi:hypothetical protein ACQPZJ_19230 [Actinoplanes sp. CA-054009]